MNISKDKVVLINYTLKNANGEVMDSSEGREPLAYLQGHGNLIPGLESELEGKVTGDKMSVVIAAEDAYGPIREEMIQTVPKGGFQGDEELKVGMQIQLETNQGAMIGLVSKIENEDVTLDLNHPLAGMELHFDVEIMEVRMPTEEELDHGHVHGPGGHHH